MPCSFDGSRRPRGSNSGTHPPGVKKSRQHYTVCKVYTGVFTKSPAPRARDRMIQGASERSTRRSGDDLMVKRPVLQLGEGLHTPCLLYTERSPPCGSFCVFTLMTSSSPPYRGPPHELYHFLPCFMHVYEYAMHRLPLLPNQQLQTTSLPLLHNTPAACHAPRDGSNEHSSRAAQRLVQITTGMHTNQALRNPHKPH
jgi:hypothetical protein